MVFWAGALLFFSSLLACVVQGAPQNRTIDDWFGDSESGARPVYFPSGDTWKDENCVGCAINPDTSRAFQGTYTAATYGQGNPDMGITMDFEGTAIYVFFILANDQGDGITTETQARFIIDDGSPTTFSHTPNLNTRTIQYDQLVFSRTGLPNRKHTLRILTGGFDRDIYVNFDYAIYTFDDAPVTLPPPVTRPSSTEQPPTSSPTTGSSSSTSSSQSSQSDSAASTGPSRSISSGNSAASQPFSSILPPGVTAPPSSDAGQQTPGNDGSNKGSESKSSSSVGGIVGGVVGGLAALAILAFLLLCFLRKRKRREAENRPLHLEDQPFPPTHQLSSTQPPSMQPYGQGTFHQAYNSDGYSGAVGMGAVGVGAGGMAGAFNGAQSAEYNPYNGAQNNNNYNPFNAPAAGNSIPTGSNTEGSVYSSPYGGIAGMGSQASSSQHPSSDNSHRRLVALNADHTSPLVAATGQTTQEEARRARQEELDRQMATVEQEIHQLDRDLKRGVSVRRRTIPRNQAAGGTDGEMELTMEEMQQQMEMMRQQIEILRENQRSDWAAGLTDDPPPGYTPDPVQWSVAARSPVPLPPLPAHPIVVNS